MREILFRGKRKDNGWWIYGSLQCFKGFSIFDEDFKNFFAVSHETIGQYTGLMDGNGKQIFEGDIVKGYNTFHHREEQYIVRYKMFGFFFCENENEWHPDYIEEMRVIGNVHDNPELIGGNGR